MTVYERHLHISKVNMYGNLEDKPRTIVCSRINDSCVDQNLSIRIDKVRPRLREAIRPQGANCGNSSRQTKFIIRARFLSNKISFEKLSISLRFYYILRMFLHTCPNESNRLT